MSEGGSQAEANICWRGQEKSSRPDILTLALYGPVFFIGYSMKYLADLHIHSMYSRATSRDCNLENLSLWAQKKGITVIGTGDFTHPAWFKEIKDKLVPAEQGLFKLKDGIQTRVQKLVPRKCQAETRFMLSVEISTIYKKGDKTRKVHHIIFAPTIAQANKIRSKLNKIGNIRSDGRPILGLDSRNLLEIVLEEGGEGCYLIPAHIWTPWFSVLGSKSGFDSIEECYDDLSDHIFALETGLSSDPLMNWQVKHLDRYRLVSNSDAHSPSKLGREANVLNTDLNYDSIFNAFKTGKGYGGTLEFYPEEGKYHLDGHRACQKRFSPKESKKHKGLCPVCKKPLTLGVLYRVEELASRKEGVRPKTAGDFQSLIPLKEIISEIVSVGPNSKRVTKIYEDYLDKLGPELKILTSLSIDKIQKQTDSLFAEAITRLREDKVIREAGYDGEFGRIKLFKKNEINKKNL